MTWTKYGLLAFILVLMFTISIFGAHFGWTVDGVPKGGGIGATPAFLWDMVTFSIDDMPVVINTVFDIVVILLIYMAVNWVRGND